MTPSIALTIWERALSEEIGIILTLTDLRDKRRIEKVLYEARKEAFRPELDALLIARPGDNPLELWILKKATDMEDIA